MDFVDGLKGQLPDEELAVIKWYMEKRSREVAQAQVTVTPVDTGEYCSPSLQTPEPSPDLCFELESSEGEMGPEMKELESPSAGTGVETPGQQCPPNEGTWDQGRTTADGLLTAGVGSNQGGNISSPTERVGTTKSTSTLGDISSPTEHVGTRAGTAATPAKRRHKTTSKENKQFDTDSRKHIGSFNRYHPDAPRKMYKTSALTGAMSARTSSYHTKMTEPKTSPRKAKSATCATLCSPRYLSSRGTPSIFVIKHRRHQRCQDNVYPQR